MAWISMGSLQGLRGVPRRISRGLGSRSRAQMDKNMNMENDGFCFEMGLQGSWPGRLESQKRSWRT